MSLLDLLSSAALATGATNLFHLHFPLDFHRGKLLSAAICRVSFSCLYCVQYLLIPCDWPGEGEGGQGRVVEGCVRTQNLDASGARSF